ncbi:MAG: branched-chain amino acid transport system ATP-binding protein [Actinomycetota bacterium]
MSDRPPTTRTKKAAGKKVAAKKSAGARRGTPLRAKERAEKTVELPVVQADGPRPDALLQVTDLSSGYGALPVLHGVSFDVGRGEIAVLLGLNGAGKSTTVLNLCGAVRPWSGAITFDGKDATKWSVSQAVREGIILVPEGRRVFPDLSVEKNLQVGAWTQRGNGEWFETQRERVFDYLPRLRERRNQLAGTLSGGEQQMLAIGRGLMANPKLLIIDEASLGLAPVIVKEVFRIVSQFRDDGVTVILVEANISALDIADVGIVFEKGVIVAEVRGDELRRGGKVRDILLG